MARPAPRAPFALRLEVLEPRTLLSSDLLGVSPVPAPDPASSLLVRFAPGTPSSTIQADLDVARAHLIETFDDGVSWVALDSGIDRAVAQQQLERDPEVVYAEPDATVQASALIPNDPGFGAQWGLNSPGNVDIDALQAWSHTQGSPATIVAVLDSGIDLANPEFAGRIWTNPDANGSDGYPGDVHGWNFLANNANVQDDDGHGTHVTGILAANGNNGIGVAGVDWNCQIMPLKVLDAEGNGSTDAMVRAIDFAVDHGARVINASWGGGAASQALADAINYAGSHGVVFVTAAGNEGTNDDTLPFYPASYRLPNEIVVAAVDTAGNLASFSNYGAHTVDLAAPGVNVLSTIPGGYAEMSGTSMAVPYVAGVVALVAGLHPSFTATQLVQKVLSTTKPLPGLAGKTVTGGIVDAARAVGQGDPGTGHVPRTLAALGRFVAASPGSGHHRTVTRRVPPPAPHRAPHAAATLLIGSPGQGRRPEGAGHAGRAHAGAPKSWV
jgi:subtilisin family serine protease